MRIVCSPAGIVDIDRPAQGIMDIRQAGFTEMVLDTSLAANRHVLESIGKSFYKKNSGSLVIENPGEMHHRLERMIECTGKEKMDLLIAMAPYLKSDTTHTDLQDRIHRLAEESIKVCGSTGCRYLIVDPVRTEANEESLWQINREFYLSLLESARENHVVLLLRNQCRNIGGHLVRGICSDGVEASEWIDRLNREAGEERFGFCMDVGICNLCGQNMYDYICDLGDRLKAVILRDCDGAGEASLLPFTAAYSGTSRTDWLNFFRGLRAVSFDGMLIMNLEDTAAAASPIIRPALLGYAKAVADYFRWQIEMEALLKKYPARVLFGAGNMCRNYMKCYGTQYPPLFTCDNNSRLWGSEFCGISVHAPEDLKTLDENTAIFICNIYYREIEQQLRDMGVKNPIEFFNDEYMPTFYFDRLTGEGRK